MQHWRYSKIIQLQGWSLLCFGLFWFALTYQGHFTALRWRHNGRDSVSNQPPGCLLNRLFRRRSKKTSKLRVIDLCAGNSPGTGEFPAQMASNAENVSIWWHHHDWYWNPWTIRLSSHWCRVYASVHWVSIGLGNGSWPVRHQAIIRTIVGILSIKPMETIFSDCFSKFKYFAYEMHLQISSAKWWPFCAGRNEWK